MYDDEKPCDYLSCAVRGAWKGSVLRGCKDAELQISMGRPMSRPYDSGPTLRGTDGVRLLVDEGFVRPERARVEACLAKYGEAEWDRMVKTDMGVTPSVARQMRGTTMSLLSEPPPDGVRVGATKTPLMGCTHNTPCPHPNAFTAKFQILSAGSGATGWSGEELRRLAATKEIVDANRLAQLLQEAYYADNSHPAGLGLRPTLWTHTIATRALGTDEYVQMWARHRAKRIDNLVSMPEMDSSVANILGIVGERFAAYEVEVSLSEGFDTNMNSVFVEAPISAATRQESDDFKAALLAAESSMDATEREEFEACWSFLTRCGGGKGKGQALYKSLLQKMQRLLPSGGVVLPEAHEDGRPCYQVTTWTALACCVGLCLSPLGDSFNPELSKHVRGSTALLKRMAIIIVEDGGDVNLVPWLLSMALLTERDESYNLPAWMAPVLVHLWGNFGGEYLLDWRPDEVCNRSANLEQGLIREVQIEIEPSTCFEFRLVLPLFGALGGMNGDRRMLERAVPLFTKHVDQQLKVERKEAKPTSLFVPGLSYDEDWDGNSPQDTMPLEHCMDQHVTPGMMHFSASASPEEAADPAAYERRFAATWNLSGYNVRTRGLPIDERDPAVVRVRRAQRAALDMRLRAGAAAATATATAATATASDADQRAVPYRTAVASTALHSAVLAGGIGDVQLPAFGAAQEDGTTASFRLVACFGADGTSIHLASKPSAHVQDDEKKPQITEDARAKAEKKVWAMARQGLPFAARELAGLARAQWSEGEGWTLRPAVGIAAGTAAAPSALMWPTTGERVTVSATFHVLRGDGVTWMADPKAALSNDDVVCDALAYVAPKSLTGIAGELEAVKSAVYGIVGALRPLQQHRLRALLRGVYKTLVMPTAPRSGRGVGSDQLGVAEPGDWDVWRALVLIARLVPGALRPADRMPCFAVPTNGALALRVVEDWVASAVSTRSASSLGTLYCSAWHGALDTVRVHMKAKSLALADYQRNCIDYMHKTDDEAQTKGHLIALDVGLGKTATAAFYLAERLLKRGGAKHILWFTESSSISGTGAATAHANQLRDTWGFCGVVHVCSADADPTRTLESIEAGDQRRLDEGEPLQPKIIVVGYALLEKHWTGRESFVARLRAMAPDCVACFDEVHLLYNAGTQRGGNALGIAERAEHVVLCSATPTAGHQQKLALRWMQLVTPFEVRPDNKGEKQCSGRTNVLTAAARTLGSREKSHVVERNTKLFCEIPHAERTRSLNLIVEKKCSAAKDVVREAMRPEMMKMAIELAESDRSSKRTPNGGLLLVLENEEEVAAYLTELNRRKPGFAARQGPKANDDPNIGIVVEVLRKLISIDLPRLGVYLTLPTYSNPAVRYQARGRLKRHTQQRKRVDYVTLVPEETCLALVFERQQLASARMASYDAVRDEALTRFADKKRAREA